MIVKDGRVQLRDEAGQAYSVPENELQGAIESGRYRLESSDEWNQRAIAKERGTLTEQAKTLGEGALEGATLGVGTAVATELGGEEYRQAAQERAAENPLARGAGVVVGTVAPALLSGGSGALGTAARFTPSGALARGTAALEAATARGLARAGVGGEAAGLFARAMNKGVSAGVAGAAEGAAYGGGQSLADSALEGTEWTAERALAGMEDGALYGLALGGGIGAGGEALGSAGRKVVQKMLGEGSTLRGAITDFANKRAIKQIVGEDVQAFRKITRNGDDMGRIEQIANKLRARGVLDEPAAIEKALQREIDDADDIATTIGRTLDERGVRPDAKNLLDEVDEQVARLKEAGTPDHRLVARKVERQMEQFRKRAMPSFTLKPGDGSNRRIVDATMGRVVKDPTFTDLRKFKSALGKTVSWAKQSKSIATEEMEHLYGSVARNLDDAAKSAGPDVATAWSAANRDMDDFITLRGGMKREAQRKAKGAFFQKGDQFGGLTGALASMAMGAGAPMTIISALGASVAHKFIRERGAAALGKLADKVARSEFAMKSTATRLAGGKVEGNVRRALIATSAPAERRERYNQVRENLMQFEANPQTVQAKIERSLSPIAADQPEVAVAMTRRIIGDYQWLKSKMPEPMTRASTSMTPTKETPRFAPRDEMRLVRYTEALAAPRSVFESLDSGRVNWDGIEALKERRPELWMAQRDYVIQALNEAPEPPTYRKRVLLGLAFDFPADYSLANVESIQKTYADEASQDTGGGRPAMAAMTTNPFEQSEAMQ